jgi:glycosyltransferase involved in cell wall biosynthesis
MKILHVATRANNGGTSEALRASILFERNAGHTSILVTGGSSHDFADYTLPLLRKSINPWFDFLSIVKLVRLIRDIKPDVVHSHESKAGFLVRLISPKKKYVLVHTVHMATFRESGNTFGEICVLRIERFLAKRTHILIFVGLDLQSLYESQNIYAADSDFVLHSRIPLQDFFKSGLVKDKARKFILENLGLEDKARVILIAGLLEKRKRPALVIQSLASHLTQNDFHLVLCGVGNEHTRLEKLAKKLKIQDRVHLMGFRKDLSDWIAGADLLLHASVSEGVPQVLVQAAAARTPVVATRFHDCRELSEVCWASPTGTDIAAKVMSSLLIVQSDFLQDFSFWDQSKIDRVHYSFLETCRSLMH